MTDNTLRAVLTDATATDAYSRRSPINRKPDIRLTGKGGAREGILFAFN